jgi:hypothetical protein
MKFATVSKSMVMGLALLLAMSAFAGTKASMEIKNPVTVSGTTLKPGAYSVQWEGNGPNVELSILRGSRVVAKVPARVVELESASANTATVTRDNGSEPSSLEGFRFQGKKYAIELSNTSASMQTGGSSE